jgi:branched-subunit amino acid ATP-binding cassette transporter
MRTLLRRMDFSRVSVISLLVSFPADARVIRLPHTSDKDFPAYSGHSIDIPFAFAHSTISRAVCGPQFRAVTRCRAVSMRSRSSGGTHIPLGGVSPVSALQEGRVLVEGTPDEIKNNKTVQEAYLGGVHGVLAA